MTDTKTIEINWETSFPRQEIREKVNPKKGLYQLYGYHPVYGSHVLLYIGKADDLKKELLSPHGYLGKRVPPFFKPELMSIRVAYDDGWDADIGVVANLLIFIHSPAWNGEEVKRSALKGRPFDVHHKGDFGGLLKVVKWEDSRIRRG